MGLEAERRVGLELCRSTNAGDVGAGKCILFQYAFSKRKERKQAYMEPQSLTATAAIEHWITHWEMPEMEGVPEAEGAGT